MSMKKLIRSKPSDLPPDLVLLRKHHRHTICGVRDIILKFENKSVGEKMDDKNKSGVEKSSANNMVKERIAMFNNVSAKYGRSISLNSTNFDNKNEDSIKNTEITNNNLEVSVKKHLEKPNNIQNTLRKKESKESNKEANKSARSTNDKNRKAPKTRTKSKKTKQEHNQNKTETNEELMACYENVTESAAKTYRELNKFLAKMKNPKVANLVKSVDEADRIKVSKGVQTTKSRENLISEDSNDFVVNKKHSIARSLEELSISDFNNEVCVDNAKKHDEDGDDDEKQKLENTQQNANDEAFLDTDFGLNTFDNDPNNFFVEAYNREGDELVLNDLQFSNVCRNEHELTTPLPQNTSFTTVNIGNGISLVFSEDDYINSDEESSIPIRNNKHSFKNAVRETYFDQNSNPRIEKVSVLNCGENSSNGAFKLGEISCEIPQSPIAIKNKIDYVIEELVTTEEKYVENLKRIVEDYLEYLTDEKLMSYPSLIGRQCYLFGNIKDLLQFSQEFLEKLKQCGNNYELVADTFVKYGDKFKLYPNYSKNKPRSDKYYKYFRKLITRRQIELDDRLDLASYLLTPIQRLGKYILLLESIDRELQKHNVNSPNLKKALSIIKNEMRRGNDYIAVDSIKSCPINLIEHGSFIMREKFNVLKPKKFESMVFLFEETLVFTIVNSKYIDFFDYVTHIPLSDLTIVTFEQEALMFHLVDYTKCKHGNRDQHTYVLEARNLRSKRTFTSQVERLLWKQLNTVREKVKEQHSKEGKRLSTQTLPRNSNIKKSKANNNLRRNKSDNKQSTFYVTL